MTNYELDKKQEKICGSPHDEHESSGDIEAVPTIEDGRKETRSQILKELESQETSTENILAELRKLVPAYFYAEKDEDRVRIERRQRQLIKQLDELAKRILESTSDHSISEENCDRLMGQYGVLMDQMAINIPWPDRKKGGERDIQNEALQTLLSYAEKRPQAKAVSRSIFMLYHHGAGIDKTVTAESEEQEFQYLPPTQEFARQYVEAEENAKKYLENSISLTFGIDHFSLDADYPKLLEVGKMTDEQISDILDVANWYRRIAYHQKVAGFNQGYQVNLKRAIELHKSLIIQDSSMSEFLEKLYKEQDIQKSDQ